MIIPNAARLKCLHWASCHLHRTTNLSLSSNLTILSRKMCIDMVNKSSGTETSKAAQFNLNAFYSSMPVQKVASSDSIRLHKSTTDEFQPSSPEVNRYTDRTHNCGQLDSSAIGESVTLCGWLQFVRMNKFLTLRDGYGETQVMIPPELADTINLESIPYESILKVCGRVLARPPPMVNPKMATGEIEVLLESLEVLNKSRSNLPMEVRGHNRAKEVTRLEHRYIDLRFADMQRNMRMRSTMLMRMREYLVNHAAFVEVETPTLFRRTPGGAQEFVVPSRKAGHFYSLVQSPQQFKQMLMAGAVDRYFQIARCYRDESTRPDRQPEFTQLDVELSFTDRESIMELVENLLVHCWPTQFTGNGICKPFPCMTYNQAMEEYGCDKPDTRFEMKLKNVTNEFGFNDDALAAYAIVAHINPAHKYPKTMVESLLKIASDSNSKFEVVRINKEPEQWIKYNKIHDLSQEEMRRIFEKLEVKRNDTICLAVGQKSSAQTLMGRIRLAVVDHLEQSQILPLRPSTFNFLWVIDFPMFSLPVNQTSPLESVHHPFTAPHPEDAHLLHDPIAHPQIRSQAYDLVLNGQEVGGGSIRIHDAALQTKVLDDILQIDHSHLAHLIDALASGCPPHGGIALGLDRLLAIVCGTNSIRDVIAFPKGADGKDALTKAPVPISQEELDMYHIAVKRPTT